MLNIDKTTETSTQTEVLDKEWQTTEVFTQTERIGSHPALNESSSSDPKQSAQETDKNSNESHFSEDSDLLSAEEVSDNEITDPTIIKNNAKQNSSEENNRNKSLNNRFECLWSGCQQWFTNKRALNLHTLRKHKTKVKSLFDRLENNNRIITTSISRIDIPENSHQLNAEEVSDNNSEGIDCDINYENQSNDETLDERVDENTQQNCEEVIESTESSKNINKNIVLEQTSLQQTFNKEIQSEDNSEIISNEIQLKTERVRSLKTFRKQKHNSISGELKDNYNECNDNSETDIDYITSDDEISDDSEEGFDGTANKSNEKVFECDFEGCAYRGSTAYNLNVHKKRIHLNEKPFECSVNGCDKRFAFNSDLNKHKKNVHQNKGKELDSGLTFRCDYENCTKEFNSKEHLQQHKNKHLGKFVCDWDGCGFVGESNAGLNVHKQSHSEDRHQLNLHSEDIPWIYCSESGCDFKTKLRWRLFSHYKWRHESAYIEERKRKKFVSECGTSFSEAYNLKNHKAVHSSHLSSPLSYKCKWKGCEAVLKTKKRLRCHLMIHKGTYKCVFEGCAYVAGNRQHLELHKTVHSKDRRFKCTFDDCNKLFKNEMTLRGHKLRVHPNELKDNPWLNCPQSDCSFKTKFSANLKRHEMKHRDPHICKECSKPLRTPRGIKEHMAVHRGESVRRIPCDWNGCERMFKTSSGMRDHMNSHTLEKSHPCVWPGCTQTYTTKHSLDTHMHRHQGKGRYNCPHCDYGSTNPIRYKNHLKKHENQTN